MVLFDSYILKQPTWYYTHKHRKKTTACGRKQIYFMVQIRYPKNGMIAHTWNWQYTGSSAIPQTSTHKGWEINRYHMSKTTTVTKLIIKSFDKLFLDWIIKSIAKLILTIANEHTLSCLNILFILSAKPFNCGIFGGVI